MAYLPVLYRIQEIENRLRAVKFLEEKLRNNPELKALKSKHTDLQTKQCLLREGQSKSQQAQLRLDLELKNCREHVNTIEGKLYNGSISNSRELEQMQHKIAEYRAIQSQIEDELLKLMEEDEKLAQELATSQQVLNDQERQADFLQKKMKQELTQLIMDKQDLTEELASLTPEVPPERLERFYRIASAHQGVAIAKMRADSCGACHVSQSESILLKVKRGDDAIYLCENCGRILYY